MQQLLILLATLAWLLAHMALRLEDGASICQDVKSNRELSRLTNIRMPKIANRAFSLAFQKLRAFSNQRNAVSKITAVPEHA